MKLWAIILVSIVVLIGVSLWQAFAWWSQMYTVGIDFNLKAIALAGIALVLVSIIASLVVIFGKKRRRR